MKTNLFPHNQRAVDAIKSHYAAGNRKAAVVHATGTGKSYIIAAVTDDYKRVLVIAPNNFVLYETKKVCHSGCEFRTYASVMYDECENGKYDIIVLDEFHRGGADKWSEGVQRIIAANPDALLLGTSATHIRYLDNQRNMADELFDGQVVSYLPLKSAIDQQILPNPTYVSSIYTMEDMVHTRKQKIRNCQKNDIDKEDLCRRLDGIAHNWENAGGVPKIIRKYFSHDMQRIIVFCSKVKRAAEARQMLSKWFGMAGFNKVRYYNIDYKEKRLENEMADFQEPLGDYDLKVAISVNMLNEGVHIPHVDGVIMLRSTISRIIIEQQVGRCLTSNNAGITPVVLDLVNNMDLIRYDEPVKFGEWNGSRPDSEQNSSDSGFPFKVIDECRDMRVLLEQLDYEIAPHIWTRDELEGIASKYSTIVEWVKNDKRSYHSAVVKPYYHEIISHMERTHPKWSREELEAVAKKYESISDWKKYDKKSFGVAISKTYYQEITAHMTRKRKTWSRQELTRIALLYSKPSEWKACDPKSYSVASTKPYYQEITSHMDKVRRYTREQLQVEAKKYNTPSEWYTADIRTYSAAVGKTYYREITAHMKKVKRHTHESIINEAKECSSYTEFVNLHRSAYMTAYRLSILDEIKNIFNNR